MCNYYIFSWGHRKTDWRMVVTEEPIDVRLSQNNQLTYGGHRTEEPIDVRWSQKNLLTSGSQKNQWTYGGHRRINWRAVVTEEPIDVRWSQKNLLTYGGHRRTTSNWRMVITEEPIDVRWLRRTNWRTVSWLTLMIIQSPLNKAGIYLWSHNRTSP